MPEETILVHMSYGKDRWRELPFEDAARILQGEIISDRKACWEHQKLNEEHWISSFWSERLGGAEMPNWKDWDYPITALNTARRWYQQGDCQATRRWFHVATNQFNFGHFRKFLVDFIVKGGANVAKESIESAAKKAKGKNLSRGEFLSLVCDEFVANLAKVSKKQLVESIAGTNASNFFAK